MGQSPTREYVEDTYRLALSGTPGTGKSTIAGLLSSHGIRVSKIEELAQQAGALEEVDATDGAHPVDMDILLKSIDKNWQKKPSETQIIDGHLSHNLPVNAVVILRCEPEIIRRRLNERGYPQPKVEANVEWELLGGAWNEKENDIPWVEFDTSKVGPEVIVANILSWISDGFKPTSPEDVIDWVG
jgi:adenylate kinase